MGLGVGGEVPIFLGIEVKSLQPNSRETKLFLSPPWHGINVEEHNLVMLFHFC